MISLITPAHNEEKYIEACLFSVKAAAERVSEEVLKEEAHLFKMHGKDYEAYMTGTGRYLPNVSKR